MKEPLGRNLYWSLTGAVSFLVLAVAMLFTEYWPASLPFFYACAFSLWGVSTERRKRRRLAEERQWWIREKRGVVQPPLDPCCVMFGRTGTMHQDIRCTRDRTVERLAEQAEWADLLREPLDVDREEDM